MKEKTNFEDSYEKLREAAEALKNTSTSLEDSLKCFEDASKYYKDCREILDRAKQRLEVLNKVTDEVSGLEQ